MNRTPVTLCLEEYPEEFHPLLSGGEVFDSSCSSQAQVLYIPREGGLFLKSAPKGTLKTEAELTHWFSQKGLSAKVDAYLSRERDWLLTRRIPGEDCIHPEYLSDPKRLSALTGELLRTLHETDHDRCPVPNRTRAYLAAAEENHRAGRFDPHLFPDHWQFASREEAWEVVCQNAHLLKADTLLHGDYCLPNILLDNWRFSGFIDVGCGGVGDRHIDLFWGMWTLFYNLKTDRYADRFLDAYGRQDVEPELFRVIAAIECFG